VTVEVLGAVGEIPFPLNLGVLALVGVLLVLWLTKQG
jgi:hypothetical protein